MSPRKGTRAERRELVEAMLVEDHTRSDRSIARASAASHTHVADCRRQLVAAGRIAERPCRPTTAVQADGNLTRQQAGRPGPALRHGATSEIALAPLLPVTHPRGGDRNAGRDQQHHDGRERFPAADDAILRVQAGRLARHDALTEHLDRAGVKALMRRDGSLRPAATMLSRLEDAIERCHERLSGAAASGGVDPYAEYRRITGGKAAGG